MILVKDDIIKEVKVVQLKTAHSYYIDERLRQLLIDKDINKMKTFLYYNNKKAILRH